MKKRENILFLLFPVLFVFYLFFMKGHIANQEESGFFLADSGYLCDMLSRPGGGADYLGNFLSAFYGWPWVGALIMTLIPLGIFLCCRKIMRRLEIPSGWLIAVLLPALLAAGIQFYAEITPGIVLKFFFFYLFFLLYLSVSSPVWRYVVFSLGLPLAWLFLPGGGGTCLYVTFALYELWRGKGVLRFGIIVLWAVMLAVYPSLWQRWMAVVPGEEFCQLTDKVAGDRFDTVFGFIYAYGLMLLGLSWLSRRIRKPGGKMFYVLQLVVIAGGMVWAGMTFFQHDKERMLRIDQAVQEGRWQEVVDYAAGDEQISREKFHYLCLALACRGELGDRLFDYPVNGLHCLYLPRDFEYYTVNLMLGEFYYHMQLPNEVIHWTLQASVASPMGMNMRILRRLAEANIQKGDSVLAEKYLTILDHTLFSGEWVRQHRALLADTARERILPQLKGDFFIGGRPFLSDMARLLDAGRNTPMVVDYILCGLLLKKDLGKFCQIFTRFYPYKEGDRIPKAYEEALLVGSEVGNQSVVAHHYPFTVECRRAYQNYTSMLRNCGNDKAGAMAVMKSFRNTWWYYFHFTEILPMDEQGRIAAGAMH